MREGRDFWGRLPMSKVFLAYKTTDAERANVVREKLELLGVPLFVDQKMMSGDNYISTINEELNSALAVLVLWTAAAVHMPSPGEPPNFVLSEAQRGYSRGILVAATFERIALDHLPVPFNLFQAPDLSDWIQAKAPAKHREWQKVLQALGKKLNRPGIPDLAVAFEGDDGLRKKFLREYPSDPSAPQIADRLEAVERKAFEARLSSAKRRNQQRAREAEKRLASLREQFEAQIGELRAGRDFMLQTDPSDIVDDDDERSQKLEKERIRADQAEDMVAKTNREVVELTNTLAGKATALDAQNAAIAQLNSDLAKRDKQLSGQQSTIASQAAELATIASEAAAAQQALETKGAQVGELGSLVTSLKQRLQGQTQRAVIWSGGSALAAALVFGLIGTWSVSNPQGAAGDIAGKVTTATAALNSQIDDLKKQNQTSAAQIRTLQDQAKDAANKSQSAAATLDSQVSTLRADNQTLQNQVVQLRAQATQAQTDAATLRNQLADLTSQKQLLQKQLSDSQAAAAAAQASSSAISLVAQCDALSAYQYDQDRPPNSGWIESDKDVRSVAQPICQGALQTTINDRKTQRRILLQIGRIYKANGNAEQARQNWEKAATLGSSRANNELATFYVTRGPNFDANKAWSYVKTAVNNDPADPAALYRAAITLLFPNDSSNPFVASASIATQGDASRQKIGEAYLQKAISLDYPSAYYIAGAYYWRTDPTQAKNYLITSWCIKQYRDPPDDAGSFYQRQTHQPLSCQ
jgi:uncharacterized protein (DUF3084 family)